MLNKKQTHLVELLSKEIAEGNLAIFAGAGFSQEAGFVDWKNLLKPFADELDLDIDKEWDLVTLAQYYTNANKANRSRLNQTLVTNFSQNITPTDNHRILARLPIRTYWTTNYDNLIESAIQNNGKIPDVKYTVKQLATTIPHRDTIIYKMHGDYLHAADAVLIRDDYERYHIKMQPFITALSGDLVSKTFLFLGFSFTDPNIDYILSRVRIQYSRDNRQHHCILRQAIQFENELLADFEYRQRKEKLFEDELGRFGIKVTYINEYSDINLILKAIENKYKRRTVFISGAAHSYEPWNQSDSERFVYDLSREINKAKFRVISGFGLGIGSAVISGVAEQTISNGGRLDDETLILRPFPQNKSGNKPLTELWSNYRHSMLDHAGIAIFMFGNKLKDGQIIESDGMQEEFDIACQKGILVIPIGITGSISMTLWKRVMNNYENYNFPRSKEILPLFQQLGEQETNLINAKEIILSILKLI
ncbi:SIR2 family protein [Arsenophonus sp.]|uniref:SIR2 family protein n=1 Tax=Arsenophonus sp. TaxID=1872640 RepID=UPI002854E881|nr:SIR2 family protein [Arsenophonus sp.]MDR5617839.1 SIR2 family protein [Arsenophonus sp.]